MSNRRHCSTASLSTRVSLLNKWGCMSAAGKAKPMRWLLNLRLGLRLAREEALKAAAIKLKTNPDRTLPDGELIRETACIGAALKAVEKEIDRRCSDTARIVDEGNSSG